MVQSRRDVMTAGAIAALSTLMPVAAAGTIAGSGDPHNQSIAVAYRQAFAEFEAAVRPSSEIYWHSHNRAVADVYARDKALRRSAQA